MKHSNILKILCCLVLRFRKVVYHSSVVILHTGVSSTHITTALLKDSSACFPYVESPLMYDFVTPKRKNLDLSGVTDDLSTPELSFDLHNFIQVSNPADALLADILAEGFPMPQSAGFGSDRYGSEAGGIKQELTGERSFGLPQLPEGERRSKKAIDKASDEYRRRRERNNIAVRKSREKAKQRCKDTERRVCDLVSENDKLRKRVELLNKELSVLKNLLANVGVATKGLE